jgi:hypothetical protein
MFELFVHDLGRERRSSAEASAELNGRSLSKEEDMELRKYETWCHEAASLRLLDALFAELQVPLQEAGLRVDDQGDDFALIRELIDPPKRSLEKLMDQGALCEKWDQVIRGRPFEKAWMYEIVSNWRSGIDVDKFDYFRRDAQYLGIQRQFDHDRYFRVVRVLLDPGGVPTISPPDKDKDVVRDNMLELRKTLHHMAYQHKTVKKLECHMIDILKTMDEHVYITGVGGRKLKMSQAAVEVDIVAYPKLIDTYIEGQLLSNEHPLLADVAAEYEERIMRRQLMRLVADWDLPYGMPLPTVEAVISGVRTCYEQLASTLRSAGKSALVVMPGDLRCQAASIHTGMKDLDPITRLLFHNTKTCECKYFRDDSSAKPARHKVWVFWNPPADQISDDLTTQRLTRAFEEWATSQVDQHEVTAREGASAATDANGMRKKRILQYKASCPLEDSAVLDAAPALEAGDRFPLCTPSPRRGRDWEAALDVSIPK